MDEMGIEEVKARSIRGVIALTSRTFFLQLISFLTTFLLTIFLTPSIFGIYFVVSAIINFLAYFSDIGLAAALVQKKEAVTDDDLKTTFTIQQALVGVLVLGTLGISGGIGEFYNLNNDGIWLFRSLIIAFFLSSLKTIPSILLERKLEFNKLIIPQIMETVFFSVVVIVLAIRGFGITSFTWAVLARGISGLIAIYIISPWKISFRFKKEAARKLLKFGLPFQTNSFLALIKDDLLTVFLGKILPFSQIGYIGWAKKWSEFPLRLIMDNIVRVTFPAFSRLQHSPKHLKAALEKTIFFLVLLIFPMSLLMIIFIRPLIYLIPKYLKWEPALFSFYLFVLANIFSTFSTPLTNVLNAIGKIKISLKLMLLWTILNWILTPVLVFTIGFNGVSISSFLIASSTVIIPIIAVKKYIKFELRPNIFPTKNKILSEVKALWQSFRS